MSNQTRGRDILQKLTFPARDQRCENVYIEPDHDLLFQVSKLPKPNRTGAETVDLKK